MKNIPRTKRVEYSTFFQRAYIIRYVCFCIWRKKASEKKPFPTSEEAEVGLAASHEQFPQAGESVALAQSRPPSNKLLSQKTPKKRCCYYYRVKLCLLAAFRLDPPPTVLGRQNLERAKFKIFFARRIETSATRRPKVVSALDCLRKCLTREEAPWGATKWSPPSPCRWPFTCRDVQ